MKLLLDHPKAKLQYNEDTNAIELIWKQYHDEESYKLLFLKGQQHLIELKATAWLSDIRNEGVVSPANSKWLQKEIIPKSVAHGLRKIAVVMDSDVFKQFYVKNVHKTIGQATMKFFYSLEEANKWLKEVEEKV